MLTGRRFKLDTPTLVIDFVNGRRQADYIPAGAVVKVLSGPTGNDRMVDVLWQDRTVTMFAIDLKQRGIELRSELPSPPPNKVTSA